MVFASPLNREEDPRNLNISSILEPCVKFELIFRINFLLDEPPNSKTITSKRNLRHEQFPRTGQHRENLRIAKRKDHTSRDTHLIGSDQKLFIYSK
jgi:hypothetical protein